MLSRVLRICARNVSLSPFEGPRVRCRRADRKLHYLIRVLQSDPAKVAPTRIALRFDQPFSARLHRRFHRAKLLSWKLRHGLSLHREEPITRHGRSHPRCNDKSARIGETFARVLVMLYKFWNFTHTHTHTHAYVHIQNTHVCAIKEKSININIYNILYYTCSRNLSRLHYLDYDVTLCKITLRTTHIYRATS